MPDRRLARRSGRVHAKVQLGVIKNEEAASLHENELSEYQKPELTQHSSDPISLYLGEIRKLRRLSREEEPSSQSD